MQWRNGYFRTGFCLELSERSNRSESTALFYAVLKVEEEEAVLRVSAPGCRVGRQTGVLSISTLRLQTWDRALLTDQ